MRFGPPKVKNIHLCLYSSKVEYLDIFLVRQTNLFIYLFLISKNHIYTKGCSVQLDRLIYEENYFSLLSSNLTILSKDICLRRTCSGGLTIWAHKGKTTQCAKSTYEIGWRWLGFWTFIKSCRSHLHSWFLCLYFKVRECGFWKWGLENGQMKLLLAVTCNWMRYEIFDLKREIVLFWWWKVILHRLITC